MPKVSIVIPNYNYARFLPERMESIFLQTYQDYEVILLDDCSTDDSRELLTEYAKHEKVTHCIFNEQNSGSPFEQWHKGVMLARGEWVWIAEADDVADSCFLDRMMEVAIKSLDVTMIFSHLRCIDANGKLIFQQQETEDVLYTGEQFIKEKLIYSTTIFNVSSCVFRRETYLQLDTMKYRSMKKGGDYMFYVLMAEHGCVFECGSVLDNFRCHAKSTSHSAGAFYHKTEGLNILDYITSNHKIKQSKYILSYAKYVDDSNFSSKDKFLLHIEYVKHGYWMMPIVSLLYQIKRLF